MSRSGTNNGGGPRWATMPRGKCPVCGLVKPVGIYQADDRGNVCRNSEKCEARRKRNEATRKVK